MADRTSLVRYLLLYVIVFNLSPNLTQNDKPCDGLRPPKVIIKKRFCGDRIAASRMYVIFQENGIPGAKSAGEGPRKLVNLTTKFPARGG